MNIEAIETLKNKMKETKGYLSAVQSEEIENFVRDIKQIFIAIIEKQYKDTSEEYRWGESNTILFSNLNIPVENEIAKKCPYDIEYIFDADQSVLKVYFNTFNRYYFSQKNKLEIARRLEEEKILINIEELNNKTIEIKYNFSQKETKNQTDIDKEFDNFLARLTDNYTNSIIKLISNIIICQTKQINSDNTLEWNGSVFANEDEKKIEKSGYIISQKGVSIILSNYIAGYDSFLEIEKIKIKNKLQEYGIKMSGIKNLDNCLLIEYSPQKREQKNQLDEIFASYLEKKEQQYRNPDNITKEVEKWKEYVYQLFFMVYDYKNSQLYNMYIGNIDDFEEQISKKSTISKIISQKQTTYWDEISNCEYALSLHNTYICTDIYCDERILSEKKIVDRIKKELLEEGIVLEIKKVATNNLVNKYQLIIRINSINLTDESPIKMKIKEYWESGYQTYKRYLDIQEKQDNQFIEIITESILKEIQKITQSCERREIYELEYGKNRLVNSLSRPNVIYQSSPHLGSNCLYNDYLYDKENEILEIKMYVTTSLETYKSRVFRTKTIFNEIGIDIEYVVKKYNDREYGYIVIRVPLSLDIGEKSNTLKLESPKI